MEIKPVYAVVALAVVFVGLLAFSMQAPATPPAGPDLSAQAAELYLRGAAYGQNAAAYEYSYTEYSNGFPENYTLASDGKNSYVDVLSALSWKRAYFLENDTILCIRFQGAEACSSVKNESSAKSLITRMKGRLFDGSAIGARLLDDRYRINRSLLTFSPTLTEKILPNGRECTEIKYTLDYSTATLTELNRFGIGTGSPQQFRFVSCIGSAGEIERLDFNYTYAGRVYESGQSLVSADLAASPEISPPETLNASAITLDIAYNEYSARNDFWSTCYVSLPQGDARDSCIQKFASVTFKQKELCGLAGTLRDRCMVALMPYLKDPAVCTGIGTPEFRDDCYIELAGAFRNDTWCAYVNDSAKKGYCMQVANPQQEAEPVPDEQIAGNTTDSGSGNESVSVPTDVSRIFGNLELEENATSNSTKTAGANNTNSSG